RRGHFHGLRFAAGFRRAVVVVAGVGGDPVVGADRAERRALGRFVGRVAVRSEERRVGRGRGVAWFVCVELPGDRAVGGRGEQAGFFVLGLRRHAGLSRGWSSGVCSSGLRRGHFHGLRFAAGFRRAVVVVAGVGGDPVVGADRAERRALGRFVGRVAV